MAGSFLLGDGATRPLLIVDAAGSLLGAVVTNKKGFEKSLERGDLWVLHPQTGRLVPILPGSTFGLSDAGVCYKALSPAGLAAEAVMAALQELNSGAAANGTAESRTETASGAEAAGGTAANGTAESRTETASGAAATGPAGSASRSAGDEKLPETAEEESTSKKNTLLSLQGLVRQRRRDMPEGSYTTHMFSKGEDKIRKKAGEEAVELLLARTDDELVSETADFLYHLLVLFVAKDIPFERVLEELERR